MKYFRRFLKARLAQYHLLSYTVYITDRGISHALDQLGFHDGTSLQGSQRASKDEAMRQIHSETQRLIRSSEVSLPYHRPKQRSLQDFLNRKKFIPALPEGLTTAAKVKMSSEIVRYNFFFISRNPRRRLLCNQIDALKHKSFC